MTHSGPETRVLADPPASLPLMLKAALPALPGIGSLPGVRRTASELPDLTLARHDVPLDPAHVAAYAEVCGFPRKDTVPLPYPHLLAFGLHLSIMTDRSFPFPAMGTVHLENSITSHRPVAVTERLQVTAHAENLRGHAKGRAFDLVTTVHSRGELVWEATSTYLRRGRGADGVAPDPVGTAPDPVVTDPTGPIWRLPADLGRRYAGVSGDRNPIHLYALSAKALGFPRQIAHGMWSLARCVATLENRLAGRTRVDVAFRKPILLPGPVAFGSRRLADGYGFSLTDPRSGAPHLAGRTTEL